MEDYNTQQSYCQEAPMTFEERVAMYMKCDKIELAKMLAERDTLRMDVPRYYIPQPYIEPISTTYEITCNGTGDYIASTTD